MYVTYHIMTIVSIKKTEWLAIHAFVLFQAKKKLLIIFV
jgi:hypothetical protein